MKLRWTPKDQNDGMPTALAPHMRKCFYAAKRNWHHRVPEMMPDYRADRTSAAIIWGGLGHIAMVVRESAPVHTPCRGPVTGAADHVAAAAFAYVCAAALVTSRGPSELPSISACATASPPNWPGSDGRLNARGLGAPASNVTRRRAAR